MLGTVCLLLWGAKSKCVLNLKIKMHDHSDVPHTTLNLNFSFLFSSELSERLCWEQWEGKRLYLPQS